MRKIKIIWVIFSMILITFIWIMVTHSDFYGFDEKVFNFMFKFHNDILDRIMYFFTCFGASYILIVLALLMLLMIDKKLGYLAFLNLSLSTSANLTLKAFFHRERPTWKLFDEFGFSFPSGHAMIGLAFYGYIFYMIYKFYHGKYKKLYLTLLGILIFIIGVSRIYFGVHYFSDVIAGFLFASIYLLVLIHFTREYLVKWMKLKTIENKK